MIPLATSHQPQVTDPRGSKALAALETLTKMDLPLTLTTSHSQITIFGANDPYKSLKRTLNTEINEEAWETLHSDTSRPFPKPKSGRIAVKVINHLGDEVMKVFRI